MDYGRKMTQQEEILLYLTENGSITRLQAANELFIFELSSRMGELRKKGYKIASEWQRRINTYGRTVRFKKYWLEENNMETTMVTTEKFAEAVERMFEISNENPSVWINSQGWDTLSEIMEKVASWIKERKEVPFAEYAQHVVDLFNETSADNWGDKWGDPFISKRANILIAIINKLLLGDTAAITEAQKDGFKSLVKEENE